MTHQFQSRKKTLMRVQAFNLFDALLVVDTHPGVIKKGPFKSFRAAGVREER